MSIGSVPPILNAIAGSSLAQARGTESERGQNLAAAENRQSQYAEKAERAAGVATTEQDQETEERDADGRRMWEKSPRHGSTASDSADAAPMAPPPSRDVTGQAGNQLDLSG